MAWNSGGFGGGSISTKVWWAIWMGVLLVAGGGGRGAYAATQEFKSNKGFTIQYPSDWKAASQEQTDEMQKLVAPVLQKAGVSDLNRFALVLLDPSTTSNVATLNVVVTDGAVPLSDTAEVDQQVRKMIKQIGSALNAQVSDVQVSVETVGHSKAAISHYTLTAPVASLRQTQMIVPGNRKTYIFTCTSPKDRADHYDPIFKAMLESVVVEKGGLASLPTWVLYAVVGGVIGGVVALVLGLVKKSVKAPGQR